MKSESVTTIGAESESGPISGAGDSVPLVSIICFCMNRVSTIARCVESVVNQPYANLEFVVQDGASTDGTLEILRSYADKDARVKVISEPDGGHHEAFLKVLHRCKGDIVGCCLSDEELLPNAVGTGVDLFRTVPHAAAITCDGYISDSTGNITGEFIARDFDIVDYLFGRYCPFYPGSFFRRSALIEIGLFGRDLNSRALEFEIWRRLGTAHEVRHFPVPISKYGIHGGELSHQPEKFNEYLDAKAAVIDRMFSIEGFFGKNELLRTQCLINQVWLTYNHARAYKITGEATKLANRIYELKKRLRMLVAEEGGLAVLPSRRAMRAWVRIASVAPAWLRENISPKAKIRARQFFGAVYRIANPTMWAGLPRALCRKLYLRARRWTGSRQHEQDTIPDIPAPQLPLNVYKQVAALYDARGQIVQALDLLKRAEVLSDPTIDTIANYTILKEPSANYDDIRKVARHWARRHAKPIYGKGEPRFRRLNSDRKIRLGYHCSWMDSYVFHYIMGRVIQSHDRSKFEVFGYSHSPIPKNIAPLFDSTWRANSASDAEFVDKVRQDEIDVFVEVSGFSTFNRFSAMASRCAPVQISYVNHTGTTEIPNVDYVIADEICLPSDGKHDRHFSEAIYRLPSCFLCYDYEGVSCPPVAAPPFIKSKKITFGCFGTGSKINPQLIEWWVEILHRVPGSIMYVRNPQLDPLDNRRHMENCFQRYGIGPDRLRLEGGTDWFSLMKAYADVDIVLDTWPYNGGNSVAEPLWQGVPVVTFTGERFSSRYGSSLVNAAGCAALIGNSADDYISIAVALAGDGERLMDLRHNLRNMCKEYGLGDSQRLAHALDVAYADMISRYWQTHSLGV
jgi:glycosyltransferase involved in cell wall biosynthesis